VIQCGLKTTTKKVNQTGTSCLFTIFFSTASAVTRHLATTITPRIKFDGISVSRKNKI